MFWMWGESLVISNIRVVGILQVSCNIRKDIYTHMYGSQCWRFPRRPLKRDLNEENGKGLPGGFDWLS